MTYIKVILLIIFSPIVLWLAFYIAARATALGVLDAKDYHLKKLIEKLKTKKEKKDYESKKD